MRARKTAVKAKSSPQRAGSSRAPPNNPPRNVEIVQDVNITSPPPSRKAASRRPFVNSDIVRAQFSSAIKKTLRKPFERDSFEKYGERAAPIKRCRSPMTSVARTMAATGSGESQMPTTIN